MVGCNIVFARRIKQKETQWHAGDSIFCFFLLKIKQNNKKKTAKGTHNIKGHLTFTKTYTSHLPMEGRR